MGHRLRRTAQRLTGLPDRRIGLSLFANEATVQALIRRGGAGSQPWKVRFATAAWRAAGA